MVYSTVASTGISPIIPLLFVKTPQIMTKITITVITGLVNLSFVINTFLTQHRASVDIAA